MPFVLSRRAAQDYVAIHHAGLENFGVRQAEAYLDRLDAVLALIGEMPRIGRTRPELPGASPTHRCGSHVILWDIRADGTADILRIRHQREDWLGDADG